jgi:hypothetical protein
VPGKPGQALAQQISKQGPPMVKGGQELVEPGFPGRERRDGGDDAEVAQAPPGICRDHFSQVADVQAPNDGEAAA